jgi:endonuclease/exonuclease/phosphatase family metal-dependent hydrolase
MKKILGFAGIMFCIILSLFFITSCFSAFISPARFSYMPLFAIAFPYFFTAMLIVSIISLLINRKSGLIMLVLLLPGIYNISNTIAFHLPSAFNNNKTDTTLRIMTWNVQDFVDLTEKSGVHTEMLRLITQKNPDIVCMQEYTNVESRKRRVSIRAKMDSMGYPYYYLSNDEIIKNKAYAVVTRGCGIFSKIPFTDSGRINISKNEMNENLIYADINFRSKPLRIYTAHLKSFSLFKDTGNSQQDIYELTYHRKRTIQYKLRDIEKMHSREVDIIRSLIAETKLPVIYCGDMNAVPSSYTYHTLKDNLQDAFLVKGSGAGKTFYKILPTLRIDYILADKRFEVVQCGIIPKNLSDHYPVVADLKWK